MSGVPAQGAAGGLVRPYRSTIYYHVTCPACGYSYRSKAQKGNHRCPNCARIAREAKAASAAAPPTAEPATPVPNPPPPEKEKQEAPRRSTSVRQFLDDLVKL